MNIEEAYVAVIAQLPLNAPALRPNSEDAVRAGFLVAHVGACKDFIYKASVAGYASSQPMSEKRYCGDDWWCEDALEMKQLGVEAT